jgi:hypothetical protein
MPTGYTAPIIDKEGFTFRDYALGCMRAFGACVEFREEPMDKVFTEVLRDTYYDKRILEIRKEIAEFEAKSLEQKHTWAVSEIIARRAQWQEELEKSKANIAKYEAVLAEVRKWEPPTSEHVNFKTFMLQQIEESIKFDGMVDFYEKELAKKLDPDEVIADHLKGLHRTMGYSLDNQQKANQRHKEANAWLKAVLDSLPPAEVATTK